MAKREYGKRQKEEQEATARVFKDFIDTFHSSTAANLNKTFIRSSVLYAEKETVNVGQIYNPKPLLPHTNSHSEIASVLECAKILKDEPLEPLHKHQKPKSNLELLKDELKQKHSGRLDKVKREHYEDFLIDPYQGYDVKSTNLYLTNMSTKIMEHHLINQFGSFGPLASVKIMWPRGDDKPRSSNCGFVAFMSRKDAERAFLANKNREDMHVGWGKPVEIPSHPIYIPPELLKLYEPPPKTGLPFNAQPPLDYHKSDNEDINDLLRKCYVIVTIPQNRKQLMIVNRMVEFVIREGPLFEAFIMNKEYKNPLYQFLFDNSCPIHIYYRWKLYSILHSDPQKQWPMQPFRMFKDGPIWVPPKTLDFTKGMPDELVVSTMNHPLSKNLSETLTDNQAERLCNILRNLTRQRMSIAEAMVFCLNHQSAIRECLELIIDSLLNDKTFPNKKLARLYLFSDVLSNCKAKRIKLDILTYEHKFIEIFESMYTCYMNLKTAIDKTNYRMRVLNVVRHLDICQILPVNVMHKAEAIFLEQKNDNYIDDIDEDHSSIDEQPLDGVNLLKRSIENNVGLEVITNMKKESKVDTLPIEYFVPSKWDTVDPNELEGQALSARDIAIMEMEERIEKKNKRKSRNRKHNH